jgi:hypothetical protein
MTEMGSTAPPAEPSASTPAAVATPPPEVAGVEVAGVEVLDADDGPRFVTVRGRDFPVVDVIPSMLLAKFASIQRKAEKLQKRLPKSDDGTPIESADPAVVEAATKMAALIADQYDSFLRLIRPADRDEFEDYVLELDPPMDGTEQATMTQEALSAITGRPTGPQ